MKKFTLKIAAFLMVVSSAAIAQTNSKTEKEFLKGNLLAEAKTDVRPDYQSELLQNHQNSNARALYLPKISMVPTANGNSLQISNPEMVNLSIEIKNAKEEVVDNWMAESLSDDAPKQLINGESLPAGTYWVEVSGPGFAALRFRWIK